MTKLNLLIVSLLLLSQLSFAQNAEAEKAMKEMMNGADAAKLMQMMSSMMNAETKPVYKFPMSMNMQVTGYDKGVKKNTTDIKYYINSSEGTFAFMGKGNGKNDKDMMIVYDSKNSAMVMLDEKEKSYMAMNTKAFEGMDMEKMMKEHGGGKGTTSNVKCSKSGKTKTIQGYPCQEHVCVDEEKQSKAEVWVTDKVPVNIAKAAKGSPFGMYLGSLDGMTGMMMMGKFYEKGQLEAEMDVTAVDVKSDYSITLSKYKKSDMFGGR